MVVSGEGVAQINFSSLIVLNESAAYLWNKVSKSEFDVEMLAELLISEYEIDSEVAMADAQTIAEQWIEAKIVAE